MTAVARGTEAAEVRELVVASIEALAPLLVERKGGAHLPLCSIGLYLVPGDGPSDCSPRCARIVEALALNISLYDALEAEVPRQGVLSEVTG